MSLDHTNLDTHAIIRGAIERSPVFNGTLLVTDQGIVLPSKTRFRDSETGEGIRFLLSLVGLELEEIYPNGISTSLPFDVQLKLVLHKGFEKAFITRPGYAIEYDYFDPTLAKAMVREQEKETTFFAGQINNFSALQVTKRLPLRYVAGINATGAYDKGPWYPSRERCVSWCFSR